MNKTYIKVKIDKLGREMIGLYDKSTDKWIKWLSKDYMFYILHLKKKRNKIKSKKNRNGCNNNFNKSIYIYRKDNLNDLGYESYSDYLKSEEWQKYKQRYLSGQKCICCKLPAYTFHHKQYSKGALNLEPNSVRVNLVPICKSCHYTIEFNDNGIKITSRNEIQKRLRDLQRKYGNRPYNKCMNCGSNVKKSLYGKSYRLCKKCKRK